MAAQRNKDNLQERVGDMAKRVGTFANSTYDLWRDKAAEMGHKAANLPDEIWNKYLDMSDRRSTLRGAKLYIESYMMGNMDAVELARIMAEDDKLRYTISDICRMRLDPPEIDIQRNTSFIDVGAGIKTFWTEIRVPLPSEVDAAHDIRNIELGIEAGKRTAGKTTNDLETSEPAIDEQESKKPSLRERFNNLKQHTAERLVERLTPIAEGKTEEPENFTKLTEEWFQTPEGKEYHDKQTYEGAKKIDDIIRNLELENAENVDNEQHEEAAKEPELKSDYSMEELLSPYTPEMKEVMDSMIMHVYRDKMNQQDNKVPVNDEQKDASQDIQPKERQDMTRDPKDGEVKGRYQGTMVIFKDNWGGHVFDHDEVNKLLNGESITFSYEKNGKQKTATGQLEWQEYNGHEFIGFKPDFSKKKNVQAEQATELTSKQHDDGFADAVTDIDYDIPDVERTEDDYGEEMLPDDYMKLFEDSVGSIPEETSGFELGQ